MTMKELKDALLAARKAQGLSLENLAGRTDLAEGTLARTLRDPANSPTGRLHRICKELSVVLTLELGKE